MRRGGRYAAVLGAVIATAAGCASTTPEPREAAQAEPFRTIAPDEVVPPFHLKAENGTVFDSSQLVGKTPFVVFFFATWCEMCDVKLPVVQRALAPYQGQIPVIAVSGDDDDTWRDIPAWVAHHQMQYPIVRGARTRFTAAYDPFGGVPLLLVVDPSGRVLEVQLGYSTDDEQRLVAALALANESKRRSTPARGFPRLPGT